MHSIPLIRRIGLVVPIALLLGFVFFTSLWVRQPYESDEIVLRLCGPRSSNQRAGYTAFFEVTAGSGRFQLALTIFRYDPAPAHLNPFDLADYSSFIQYWWGPTSKKINFRYYISPPREPALTYMHPVYVFAIPTVLRQHGFEASDVHYTEVWGHGRALVAGCPIWLLASLSGAGVVWLRGRYRRRLRLIRRVQTGFCPNCDYNLFGGHARCPECGWVTGTGPRLTEPNPSA